jgi:hypothetical protein
MRAVAYSKEQTKNARCQNDDVLVDGVNKIASSYPLRLIKCIAGRSLSDVGSASLYGVLLQD